jgi:hypothetical protein
LIAGQPATVQVPPDPTAAIAGEADISVANVLVLGIWLASAGVLTFILCGLVYLTYWRRHGLTLRATGVQVSWHELALTAAASLLTVVTTYVVVFAAEYFFATDFRFWVLGVKAFPATRILPAIAILPLFLAYFVPISIATEVLTRSLFVNRPTLRTALRVIFPGLPPMIIVLAQYALLFITGDHVPGVGSAMWLCQMIPILIGSSFIANRIQASSGNVYAGSFVSAMFAAMLLVSNSLVIA